jgi:hypothetical protein
MKLWAAYMGEFKSLTPESGIAINDSLINRPIDPSGIAQMVNLYNATILSRRSVLDELQRGGILDPDMKIDAELERINVERRPPQGGDQAPPSGRPLALSNGNG